MKLKTKIKTDGTVRAFTHASLVLRLVRALSMLASITLLICSACIPEQRVVFCVFAAILAGWEVLWGTLQEIFHTKLHRGQLVIFLSCLIVFCLGRMVEATVALLIAAVGFWLREAGRKRAEEDLEFFDLLMSLRARVPDGHNFHFQDARTLGVGTVIEVLSGETVPADGLLISGSGSLDYSNWLYHHKNISLQEGVKVYCGAVNYGSPITIRVTAAGEHTLAWQIRSAAQKALNNKATVQNVLRKLTLPLGALMLLVALICGLFIPIFGGTTWSVGLYRAAGMIALAGMGELVVSVSLAFAAGINALSRRGVLFKSCRQVMLLSRITDLIFSKTGTLTERDFLIYEIVPHNDRTKDEVLYYAAAAEQVSDHLIARAILNKAGDISLPLPTHQLEIPGEGVCAVVDGKRVFVGNDMLMNRAGVRVLPYHGNGIVCFVVVEDEYLGCIVLSDPVKAGAVDAIDGLFRMGIRSIDLVTGDQQKNGESVGLSLGLHRVYCELSAADKLKLVARNARKVKYVGRIAFIGDETDGECMKAADISFALKMVEDLCGETNADILVLSDHPDGVLHSFKLSERIRKMVYVMLILSGIIKTLMFLLILCVSVPFWCVILSEMLLGVVGTILARRCRKYD